MAVARIENHDQSPHYIAPAVKDGEPVGPQIEIPAGRKEGAKLVSGKLEIATKAELDALQKRLGKGLADDGTAKLRLVRY